MTLSRRSRRRTGLAATTWTGVAAWSKRTCLTLGQSTTATLVVAVVDIMTLTGLLGDACAA